MLERDHAVWIVLHFGELLVEVLSVEAGSRSSRLHAMLTALGWDRRVYDENPVVPCGTRTTLGIHAEVLGQENGLAGPNAAPPAGEM